MGTWLGVPADAQTLWRDAFSGSDPGATLSAACPLCGEKSLRRFYDNPRPTRATREGFVGRGSSWEWCAACGAYEHTSCLVPIWWEPLQFVNLNHLTAEPEQLEIQYRAAGLALDPAL